MHRPWPSSIELHISLPVFQRLARLFQLLVGERKVVVRVGVRRGQLQRTQIGLDRFRNTSRFVEHVAEIKVSQRVTRVGFNSAAVVLFRQGELLAIVVERT